MDSDKERFWSKVSKAGPTDCWHWKANSHQRGYGVFWRDGKNVRANRVALEITKGPPPFDGAMALHSCDEPSCCNPAHLRWGTAKDNTDDRTLRRGPMVGEMSPVAILKTSQVDLIYRRRLEGYTIKEIAKELRAPFTAVENVYTGNAWSHRLGVDGNPTLEQLRAKRKRINPRKASNRIITDKMAAKIYAMRMNGVSLTEMSKRLKLPKGTISPVACGLTFAHLLGANGNPTFEQLRSVRAVNPANKLTADDVSEIKSLLSAGYIGADIAAKYGVSRSIISNIKSGKR